QDKLRPEVPKDASRLPISPDQGKGKLQILPPVGTVPSGDLQPYNRESCLGHSFHLHFSPGSHKLDLNLWIQTLQSLGDGDRRENMPPGPPPGYDHALIHSSPPFLLPVPLP